MPEAQINPRYSKYNNKEIEAILDSVAQFDDVPTAGSDRPVKSGGIAQKLAERPTAEDIQQTLQDYPTNQDLSQTLQDYPTTQQVTAALANYYTKEQTDDKLSGKQDTLTFATAELCAAAAAEIVFTP